MEYYVAKLKVLANNNSIKVLKCSWNKTVLHLQYVH